jgi:hypothetical protein
MVGEAFRRSSVASASPSDRGATAGGAAWFPPARWLSGCRAGWLRAEGLAGIGGILASGFLGLFIGPMLLAVA